MNCIRKPVFGLLCLVLVAGCLVEDPASFRTVNSLLPGHWVLGGDTPTSNIDFNPDQTFLAPAGIPGIVVRNYTGRFWQSDEVIAFRGTGVIGGIHVQFIRVQIQEDPTLLLLMTEISDVYAAEIIGVEDINDLSNDGVERALRRFDGLTIPPEALGLIEPYLKN
jgi:hypothetical protein